MVVVADAYDLDRAIVFFLGHFLRVQAYVPGFSYVNGKEVVGVAVNQPGCDLLRSSLVHLGRAGDEYLSVPLAHLEAAPPRAEVKRPGLGEHRCDAAYSELGGRVERVGDQQPALGNPDTVLYSPGLLRHP